MTFSHVYGSLSPLYGKSGNDIEEIIKTWYFSLKNIYEHQVQRALKYLIKGEYEDYIHFPPNCIEFAKLCKACITSSQKGYKRIGGPKPGRHWADIEIEKRVHKLKQSEDWEVFIKYAIEQPNTLELITKWSQDHHDD